MTPEEKFKNKRYISYWIMILGAVLIILGCTYVPNVILVVLGMLILFAGFIRKAVVDKQYREEVAKITETPEIDFSKMEYRHKNEENKGNL